MAKERYSRGGYRGKSTAPVVVGKEKPHKGPAVEEKNLFDEDGRTMNKGDIFVPNIDPIVAPNINGDRSRRIEELEQRMAADPSLIPPKQVEDFVEEAVSGKMAPPDQNDDLPPESELKPAPQPEPEPEPEPAPTPEEPDVEVRINPDATF